jgi:hypothetical protein
MVATLAAALALAAVSGSFSVVGLTGIFAGSFWPIIGMGAALEVGKLPAVAWLGGHGPKCVTPAEGGPGRLRSRWPKSTLVGQTKSGWLKVQMHLLEMQEQNSTESCPTEGPGGTFLEETSTESTPNLGDGAQERTRTSTAFTTGT